MIKIAFVINYITNNGPSHVVLDIIHNLDHKNYIITLITLFNGNDESIVVNLKDEGFVVHECKALSRIKCILGQDSEFRSFVMREQFDIIHSHGLIPDLLVSRNKGKAKTISTLHNNMFEDYVNQYGVFKSCLFTKIHLRALHRIDKIVCCSKSVYEVMKKNLNNITFVRNGIEKPKATIQITRRQLAIPDDARIFIFAGGLVPRKNVKFLISNFVKSRLKDEYLIIIGDGPEKDACYALKDDHVRMCGFQTDPVSYYDISDFYVSASTSEGFSISVLEALFCGLGLFLSDIPSHREVLEMQNEFKLGELFRKGSFAKGLAVIRNTQFNKNDIQNFALVVCSAARMAAEYDLVYCNLINGA